MNLFEEVLDLFDDKDDMIASRSIFVKELSEKLLNGEILIDEFDELTEDILNMTAIDENLVGLDRKVQITNAVNRLQKIISVVKGMI